MASFFAFCLINLPEYWSDFASTQAHAFSVQQLPLGPNEVLLTNASCPDALQLFQNFAHFAFTSLAEIMTVLLAHKLSKPGLGVLDAAADKPVRLDARACSRAVSLLLASQFPDCCRSRGYPVPYAASRCGHCSSWKLLQSLKEQELCEVFIVV